MSQPVAFVVSDTHFGHNRIIEFERDARPFDTIEEHDKELLYRWNAVVRPCDIVWHLGDVLFGKHNAGILGQLNGHKRLVLGNHDHYPIDFYTPHFERICGVAEYHGAILSHIPLDIRQRYRYTKNLHGHLHSKTLDDDWHICVSVEHTNLAPVRFREVLK